VDVFTLALMADILILCVKIRERETEEFSRIRSSRNKTSSLNVVNKRSRLRKGG